MVDWIKNGSLYYSNCECGKKIKSKPYYVNKHSGKCVKCSHKKEPFYFVFTKLKNTARTEKHKMDLLFSDFLKFTEQKNCHYCFTSINWLPFLYKDNKYIKGGGYFLDRKNNNEGYTIENCVVCCTRCNKAKSDKFSYEEWKEMTQCLKVKNNKV